jgi:hypothetical protein
MILACVSAHAQTITKLSNTGNAASFVFDDLTFTISNCTSTISGNCGAIEMKATSSATGAAIEFLGNGGTYGSNISSVTNKSGSYQIDFTLTVSGTGRTRISSVSSAVTGNSSSIGSSLTLSGVTGCKTTGGYNSGSACDNFSIGGNPATTTFGAVSSISINYALGLNASTGQTITLANTSAIFSPAPEPASIAILAVGLTALAGVRQRTRRLRI